MDAALQKEIFDLTKALIERLSSWPVVVLVFILIFRKQIESVSDAVGRIVESLLSRGFKFGLNKEGLRLEAEAVHAAVTAQEKDVALVKGLVVNIGTDKSSEAVRTEGAPVATPAPVSTRLQTLQSIGASPIATEQAHLIRADINTLNIGHDETVELLIKHLAVTQLALRAEVIYRTIFGSQIALLKFLNTSGGGPREKLLQFYTLAKTHFAVLYDTYSFEHYLNYMVTHKVCSLHKRLIITSSPLRGRSSLNG